MAATAVTGTRMPRIVGRRIDDLVGSMAIHTHWTVLALLPHLAVRTLVFPFLEQDLVTSTADLGRILVCGWRTVLIRLHDAMVAMAITATRRVDEA